MRLLAGALLVSLLIVNSVYGQIETIVVDGSTMDGADLSSVAIDDQGVMTITSKNGDYEINKVITDGDVSINSFRINNLTTALIPSAGDSATITWSTTDAVSCAASTEPAGELDDWNATTVIGTSGPLQVTFDETGVFNMKLVCEGVDSTATEMVTARVGAVNITSFTASPSAANVGDDVTFDFNWSSTNADSCFGSWPNADDLPASGSDSFTLLDIQNDTTFTLTCINVWDEDSDTESVTVSDPAPQCDVTLTAARIRDWNFGSADWPGPSSGQVRVGIPSTGYYAVKFNTGNILDSGAVTTFSASGTTGLRLNSISEVPGCFDVPSNCKTGGRVVGIGWDTMGTTSGCQLKPNTTYYWNITFTDGVNPSSSSCLGTNCETYLRVLNSDYTE